MGEPLNGAFTWNEPLIVDKNIFDEVKVAALGVINIIFLRLFAITVIFSGGLYFAGRSRGQFP